MDDDDGVRGPVSQVCSECQVSLGSARWKAGEVLLCFQCAHPSFRAGDTAYNAFCENCDEAEGLAICYCTYSGCVLCPRCVPEHNRKDPTGCHQLCPLSVRNSNVDSGKTLLLANFDRLEACETAVNKHCDEAIEELNETRRKLLHQLMVVRGELKAEIELAVKEARSCLADSDTVPKSALGNELMDYCQGINRRDFLLFSYEDEKPQPLKPLWVNIHYTLRQEEKSKSLRKGSSRRDLIPPHIYLPVLYDTAVSKYMLASETAVKPVNFSCALDIDGFSVCAVVSKEEFFVCDRYGLPFLVNAKTGLTQSLPPMNTPRSRPGLVYKQGHIYLFGGSTQTEYLRSCESYSTGSYVQDTLPDMLWPRDSFNPAVYQQNIYIIGGRSCGLALSEMFSISQNSFSTIYFEIREISPTLCFFSGEVMVVVQEGTVITYDWNTGERREKRSRQESWSNAPLLMYGEFIYLLNLRKGSVAKVNQKSFLFSAS